MDSRILKSFNNLEEYLIKEKFMGYDPYDTLLSSWIPFKRMGKWPSAIATQIQKRNPFNIRPVLGIKKDINPKAFGLFLQSYSILYKKTNNIEYLERANYFFDWLKSNYSLGYSGYCWGYNFPWSSPLKYMDAYIPSAVVTGFVVKGMVEFESISTRKEEIKEVLESVALFLDKDLEKIILKEGLSISYTPIQKDICYNASLLAAESLAKIYKLYGHEEYKEIAEKAVNFVISKQHNDGHWKYSLNENTGKERHQLDFHQGYILESIYEIKTALNINDLIWEKSMQMGLEYYLKEQFHTSGRSYWRLPTKYPVEIHNQSQGIITFTKLNSFNEKADEMKVKILNWTISNMQGKDGHFFYQIKKTHSIKISYMRWSNAWMFLAFSQFIASE